MLSWHVPGWTEENNKEPKLLQSVTCQDLKQVSSKYMFTALPLYQCIWFVLCDEAYIIQKKMIFNTIGLGDGV
jgi:hypothetical protein